MERNQYITMCRNVKLKAKENSTIPQNKWNNEETITGSNEKRYVPYQYTMDFNCQGETINIAVMYDLEDENPIACFVDDLPKIKICKDFSCSVQSQTNIKRAETLRTKIIESLNNCEKDNALDLSLKCISQMTDDDNHFYNYCNKIAKEKR